VAATKAAFSLAPLLTALSAHVYAWWLFADRRAALIAGIAYGLAPYLPFWFYERGAHAETISLALLPCVFWSMHQPLRETDRRWPIGDPLGSIAGC
jgi:hypothetical protein